MNVEPPKFPEEDTQDINLNKKSRRWLKGFIYAGLTLLVVALAVTGIVIYQANKLVDEFSSGEKQEIVDNTEPELGVEPKNKTKGLSSAETYLLVGSDNRPGDTVSRSDTTILVRVYPKENKVSMLSIPRDLWVPIPGYGENRINAAYAYGQVPLLVETLREWLGVKIDHFFQVDFTSFASIVDGLDGVYLPVDQDYYHYNDGSAENNWSSIDVDHGYQKLNGEDALAFARFRHLDSDFLRAARQQLFLREVGRQVREQSSVSDMTKLLKLFAKSTTSDINAKEALSLAVTLRKTPAENITRVVMPGTGTTINGASVLLVSDEEKEETLKIWDNPEILTKEQEQKPGLKLKDKTSLALLGLGEALSIKAKQETPAQIFKAFRLIQQTNAKSKSSRKKKKENLTLIPTQPPARLTSNKPFNHCVPEKLPANFYWPDQAVRQYQLNGYQALSAYATMSSGVSVLWMWTDWQDPPILAAPNDAVKINGQTYQVYWDGDQIRMIAWLDKGRVTWITNTLQNAISTEEMIELAISCA